MPFVLTVDQIESRDKRDAVDVAIATTFGPNTLESFNIWTDEIAESVPAAPLNHGNKF